LFFKDNHFHSNQTQEEQTKYFKLISRTGRIVSGLLLYLYASSLNPNRILHTSPRANTVDTESTLGESD
jgi:hypothetical protein